MEKKPNKARAFFKQTLRVLRITKKPNKQELMAAIKVTGLGITFVGVIGFLIFLIRQFIV